jgi:hypothetical protein
MLPVRRFFGHGSSSRIRTTGKNCWLKNSGSCTRIGARDAPAVAPSDKSRLMPVTRPLHKIARYAMARSAHVASRFVENGVGMIAPIKPAIR